MGLFEQFPYSNMHGLNLDWILQTVKNAVKEFASYREEIEDWKNLTDENFKELCDYVTNYFKELDVENEIDKKVDSLAQDGTLENMLNNILTPVRNNFQNEILTLEQRMNNFTKLENGSTTADAELIDIRTGFDGKVYNNAGEAVREQAVNAFRGIYQQLTADTCAELCSNNADNLLNNRVFGVSFAESGICANLPGILGAILTFGVGHTRRAGDMQLYFDQTTKHLYARQYFGAAWCEWVCNSTSIDIDILPQFRLVSNDTSAYNKLTSNLVRDGFYSITASLWDDLPCGHCVILVLRYSTNYVIQIAIEQASGAMYTRIVNRKSFAVYRDWRSTNTEKSINILALGDSICSGVRNSGKGFVGNIGMPYKNIGVSGATLSNARTKNIASQLLSLTDYTPDIIIANGGVNDFIENAPLGTMPAEMVTTEQQAQSLNRDTVLGALQYLCYKMIVLYPEAKKFFLLTHKTKAMLNGVVTDWTTTRNSAGYNQTEMFEAIKKVCSLYGVNIIDVFGKSIINTNFDYYVSDIDYNSDNSITDTKIVDKDGIHPLDYGYKIGYVPIIKEALNI